MVFSGGRLPTQTAGGSQALAARRKPLLVSIHGEPVGAALAAPPRAPERPATHPDTWRPRPRPHPTACSTRGHLDDSQAWCRFPDACGRLRWKSPSSTTPASLSPPARRACATHGRAARSPPARPRRARPPPPRMPRPVHQQAVDRRPAKQFQALRAGPGVPRRAGTNSAGAGAAMARSARSGRIPSGPSLQSTR